MGKSIERHSQRRFAGLPDDILQQFDLVIASVHQNLRMDPEKATSRLMAAVENKYTAILGHMTGRLLLSRPGYQPDHKKIIDACVASGSGH